LNVGFDFQIDGKVNNYVRIFLTELKKVAPEKSAEAEANWETYRPELKKCRTKEEVGRLLLSFFERSLRSVKDSLDAKTFHALKYFAVGKCQNCLYELRVHKNSIKDYIKHLHSIEGASLERGIRMADESKFEKPEEIEPKSEQKLESKRRPISLDELKNRVTNFGGLRWEIIAGAALAVFTLFLFAASLLG
jgi:hypothetical protein